MEADTEKAGYRIVDMGSKAADSRSDTDETEGGPQSYTLRSQIIDGGFLTSFTTF